MMELPVVELIDTRDISPMIVQLAWDTDASRLKAMALINKIIIFFMELSSALKVFCPANITSRGFNSEVQSKIIGYEEGQLL
jgi:hypothetical protein